MADLVGFPLKNATYSSNKFMKNRRKSEKMQHSVHPSKWKIEEIPEHFGKMEEIELSFCSIPNQKWNILRR